MQDMWPGPRDQNIFTRSLADTWLAAESRLLSRARTHSRSETLCALPIVFRSRGNHRQPSPKIVSAHSRGGKIDRSTVVISRFRLERSGFIKGKIHSGRDDTCRRRILRKFLCGMAGMLNFCGNKSLMKRSKKQTTSTSNIWHSKAMFFYGLSAFFTLCISF
jgi:hypothetical protein